MELRLLYYFLAVAREENITRAAEALHITQPTLSRQLAQLEEEVGVPLFSRGTGGRKISLTREGHLLRRRAREILDLTEKTQMELAELEEDVQGTLSIGCGEIASVRLLPELFRSFREKYPLVQFDLYTAANDLICEKMDRGLLDFGLLLAPPAAGRYDLLFTGVPEYWEVLMRPGDPLAEKERITAEDLKGVPLILPRGLSRESPLLRWLGDGFRDTQVAVACNLTANAAVMVQQGLGCAPVIQGTVPFDRTHVVSRPLSPALTSSSVLAWRRGQPFSPAATKFMDIAKKFFHSYIKE